MYFFLLSNFFLFSNLFVLLFRYYKRFHCFKYLFLFSFVFITFTSSYLCPYQLILQPIVIYQCFFLSLILSLPLSLYTHFPPLRLSVFLFIHFSLSPCTFCNSLFLLFIPSPSFSSIHPFSISVFLAKCPFIYIYHFCLHLNPTSITPSSTWFHVYHSTPQIL